MTVKELLIIMDKVKASDLYITVDAPPMFRIEGVTRPYGESKFTPHQTEDIAQSLLTERQKSVFAETMEINLGLYYPELGRYAGLLTVHLVYYCFYKLNSQMTLKYDHNQGL